MNFLIGALYIGPILVMISVGMPWPVIVAAAFSSLAWFLFCRSAIVLALKIENALDRKPAPQYITNNRSEVHLQYNTYAQYVQNVNPYSHTNPRDVTPEASRRLN